MQSTAEAAELYEEAVCAFVTFVAARAARSEVQLPLGNTAEARKAVNNLKRGQQDLRGFVYSTRALDGKEVFAPMLWSWMHYRCAVILYGFNTSRSMRVS